ncbi:potassium channel family protein [Rhodovulum sp. FJ3]|jgi:hypothetical protein|uniref:potassium channel family protein n=1 Tax=Rhodovulum sp. FJ3 TaxID=3079053 RepID=UPI00293DEB5D|nr:potassium channel family protein [Rhodovulum sp. FJ3]MDV4167616.1 potassium channel family protein [Rhodovulum sp. FJ3]
MHVELIIGTAVILASIVMAAIGFWLAEGMVARMTPWLLREPHRPKLTLVLVLAVLMILGVFTATVWLWAFTFLWLDLFNTLEGAVYFAIVAFTTLGFGDVLLDPGWRILGGMTAANGLLNMGLYTAMLVELLRSVRSNQLSGLPKRSDFPD